MPLYDQVASTPTRRSCASRRRRRCSPCGTRTATPSSSSRRPDHGPAVHRQAAEEPQPGGLDLSGLARVGGVLRHPGAGQGPGDDRRPPLPQLLHGHGRRHPQAAREGRRPQGDRQAGGRHRDRAPGGADRGAVGPVAAGWYSPTRRAPTPDPLTGSPRGPAPRGRRGSLSSGSPGAGRWLSPAGWHRGRGARAPAPPRWSDRMTAHKHLKERIRARMARTGESYTTARRHVLNALPPAEYQLTGGVHPDTHAIAGVLANRGLLDPHRGRPLTEAMVLGVGGGLGAGYILWEFKAHDLRTLVFGFRNSWQYPDRWALKTCARLGVPAGLHETGSPRQAEQELSAAVGRGVPVIAWADQLALGYRHLPAWLEGYGGHPVTIYGIDEGAGVALVDDRNRAPLAVPLDALAAARARVGSYKHRQLVLDAPAAELDTDGLRKAV